MPAPEIIRARIERVAALDKPSPLAIGIVTRAQSEADNLSLHIQSRRGDRNVSAHSAYDSLAMDITARAAMVYLPQPGETGWTQHSVPDYLEFNHTRIGLIPSADIYSMNQGSIDAMLDGDNEAAAFADKGGQESYRALNLMFRGGGLLVPPVGATTELIKMQEVATEIGRGLPSRLTEKGPEVAAGHVYLSPSSYKKLQLDYYERGDKLEEVGLQAIELVTPQAMAQYERYRDNRELPLAGEVFVYERNEQEATDQQTYRKEVLKARLKQLWPNYKPGF